jgi:hypothetical protein
VTFDEGLRWSWTFLNGWGVLFAAWNVREALLDYLAVLQVDRETRPINVLQLQVRAEIWLHAMILLALFANFMAGVLALSGWTGGALIGLIISAAALIVLSFGYAQRRRGIFRALRLRPKTQDGGT